MGSTKKGTSMKNVSKIVVLLSLATSMRAQVPNPTQNTTSPRIRRFFVSPSYREQRKSLIKTIGKTHRILRRGLVAICISEKQNCGREKLKGKRLPSIDGSPVIVNPGIKQINVRLSNENAQDIAEAKFRGSTSLGATLPVNQTIRAKAHSKCPARTRRVLDPVERRRLGTVEWLDAPDCGRRCLLQGESSVRKRSQSTE